MTSTITLTQHKYFDYQTQAQLDRLWDCWSRADKVAAEASYGNDQYNTTSDRAWATYQTALKAAYHAVASAEADKLVPVIRAEILSAPIKKGGSK